MSDEIAVPVPVTGSRGLTGRVLLYPTTLAEIWGSADVARCFLVSAVSRGGFWLCHSLPWCRATEASHKLPRLPEIDLRSSLVTSVSCDERSFDGVSRAQSSDNMEEPAAALGAEGFRSTAQGPNCSVVHSPKALTWYRWTLGLPL